MSDRLRFTTARQVFEAFPTAASDIEVSPADEAPLDFARKLLAPSRRFESIVYLAYLLPRREAVWWGCQCVRAISGDKSDDALLAAEAGSRDPDETTRRAALDLGWSRDAGSRRLGLPWPRASPAAASPLRALIPSLRRRRRRRSM